MLVSGLCSVDKVRDSGSGLERVEISFSLLCFSPKKKIIIITIIVVHLFVYVG